jgi:hypothetical protein
MIQPHEPPLENAFLFGSIVIVKELYHMQDARCKMATEGRVL